MGRWGVIGTYPILIILMILKLSQLYVKVEVILCFFNNKGGLTNLDIFIDFLMWFHDWLIFVNYLSQTSIYALSHEFSLFLVF